MATTKGPGGTTATDDLLSGIEDDEPVQRKSAEGTRAPFTPVPALIAHFQAAFSEGKAVKIKRTFGSESDARKAASVYHRHALEVAEAMDPPKSAAIRTTPVDASGTPLDDPKSDKVAGWIVRVQLTHQRKAKAEAETTPEATPEATPAQ